VTIRSLRRLISDNLTTSTRPAFLVAATMVACSATNATAQLHLTAEGMARFGMNGLTTFATGFPTSGFSTGPLGMDFPADGSVLVTVSNGDLRRFPSRAGNQTFADSQQLANFGGANAVGMARIGTDLYMAQQTAGRVVQLNNNGTLNRVVASNLSLATDLVASPLNNHLYVSAYGGSAVVEIDPSNGSTSVLASITADGLSLSQDGSILYAAVYGGPLVGHILGYNLSNRQQIFDSGLIPGGIDGTAAGYGPLSDFIYANTNSGTVVEVGLTSPFTQTLIASGGDRGDLVRADPLGNGDLFLTQQTSVMRLSGIPSPSATALLGLGGLIAARRRR
jgi:hypothetical protein